ncbi:cytidine deaminase-like protein [Irpex rosettiformis]|uniref:Cytidine deaminase-like protein n=1 Tax=Irpex rosettiformis TaxID=378272 RepID=A0ACB8U5Z2_9APHY|nr:cytidine deaminase-like protein [Irpex rosettiformis]
MSQSEVDTYCMATAIQEAVQGADEGGVPIGAALFLNTHLGSPDQTKLLGAGRNQRIQKGSPTLHGETAALEAAGRLPANVYRKCTMVRTKISPPCSMCSGAILLYGIPRVVIGENKNFVGEEELLRARGVEVVVLGDKKCEELMSTFINEHPEEWNEDIGETGEKL